MRYRPKGASSDTCPVSAITPESSRIVDEFLEALSTRKATGVFPLAKLVRSDARWADAAAVIQRCMSEHDVAARKAISQATPL